MLTRTCPPTLVLVLVLTIAALLAPPLSAQIPSLPMRLTAVAINMSNVGPAAMNVVDVVIERWTTAAERKSLIEIMLTKGQDSLLSALQKTKSKGRLRFPNWTGPDPHHLLLGFDLHYTWQTPLPEGGRRIVIATDRYIGFWEARNQPRSVDYPFTLLEIRLKKDGEGEGRMAVATSITFDKKKNTIELENYASEPVRLTTVKAEPEKK